MTSNFAVADDRRAPATAALFGCAADAFFGFARWVIAVRARAHTARILSRLDDAALKDIGLTRGQIDAVERDPRYTPRFPGF
jgi:uncharacterized protein YjiS (DUF1127 family)